MNIGFQIACIVIGYAIGAFPTAMLFARSIGKTSLAEELPPTHDLPITDLWKRTNLEWTRILVAIVDVAKGFLAVQVGVIIGANAVSGGMFIAPALAGFFAILGHNYNVFVKARFGRGLPIVGGVMAAINPVPVAIFLVCWLTGYFVIRRNYYIGLMTATFATPALLYTAPELLIRTFMRVPLEKSVTPFTLFVALMAVQVFVRHIEPMREVFNDTAEEEDSSKTA
jgi:glycerol-3-phosphate acyltransferase PlsY